MTKFIRILVSWNIELWTDPSCQLGSIFPSFWPGGIIHKDGRLYELCHNAHEVHHRGRKNLCAIFQLDPPLSEHKVRMMYLTVFPYILGIFLAWITWYPARHLPARSEQWYFTIIITIVAFGFIGFPMEQVNLKGVIYELSALMVFVILIGLSKTVSVILLPLVWFAHGAWDLAFLLGFVPVDKPYWVVQLCLPYDWLLAAYLLYRTLIWRTEI